MADAAKQEPVITMWSKEFTYDRWMKSKGIPIHRGYFIEDLRTIELEWWEERGCKSAFIQLLGQEGVSASRVSEIPPGKSLPPVKFALDEIVYVLSGRGLTTVWASEGKPKKNFEWQEHSMFLVPRNHWHVFSNMQGDKPIRLFHYSYMPMAMSALPEEQQLSRAVEDNVRWTVRQVLESPEGRAKVAEGRVKIVGAVYEIQTGRVRVLLPSAETARK